MEDDAISHMQEDIAKEVQARRKQLQVLTLPLRTTLPLYIALPLNVVALEYGPALGCCPALEYGPALVHCPRACP